MKSSTLNKLSPEVRNDIIRKEARIREIDEEIAEIDAFERTLDDEDNTNGMLGKGKKGGWW